uniref:Uncharacterized protein n=1 Tax=Arundo donax TaxID=35708 RepID=A0A0A9CVT6_ARUDO
MSFFQKHRYGDTRIYIKKIQFTPSNSSRSPISISCLYILFGFRIVG